MTSAEIPGRAGRHRHRFSRPSAQVSLLFMIWLLFILLSFIYYKFINRAVSEALNAQLEQVWHTTNIYMHPRLHEYTEKLVSKLPSNLSVAYIVNSGSEANDLAMFMAREWTKRNDVISLRYCASIAHNCSVYSKIYRALHT